MDIYLELIQYGLVPLVIEDGCQEVPQVEGRPEHLHSNKMISCGTNNEFQVPDYRYQRYR